MKIICIGRNYVAHAHELDNEVPTTPVVFMKPSTSILVEGEAFKIPDFSSNIHYECELVLKVGKKGHNIPEREALKYISQIGLGLDLTARDLQDHQKQKGLPWEIAKSFDGSTVLGTFIPFESTKMEEYEFEFKKGTKVLQKGNPQMMIFTFQEIIAYVSQFFTLEEGDLIFTGTPEGVGKIEEGQKYQGVFNNLEVLSFEVKA